MTDPLHAPHPDWSRLFERADLMAVVLDPRGAILRANPALRAACGWAAGALDHMNWLVDAVAPGQSEARARLLEWLRGGPTVGAVDVRLHESADGGRVVRWHGEVQRDALGQLQGLALLGVDISAMHAGELRLRRLAQFYRALSDMGKAIVRLDEPLALYDAICAIAVESGHASMAWIGLVEQGRVVPVAWGGAARAYVDGLDIQVPPGAAAGALGGPTAFAIAQGRPYICNDSFTDERMAPWRERSAAFGARACAAFPIRRAGTVVGALNLYFSEPGAFDSALTELLEQMVDDLCFALEHIDQDAARDRAERAARGHELHLDSIVDTALDAIVTLDARSEIVVFNRAAAAMFGVAPEQAIGAAIDRFIPIASRAAHRDLLARYAMDGTTSRRMGSSSEVLGLRANGDTFPMEASISRAGEGDGLLLTIMARDVTQMRQVEKVQLARGAAEAANHAKTEFLSRISHELRTPLNAMLGFAQLMRVDAADPLGARQGELLDLVLQAGEHLRALVDDMLDVSLIEAGRVMIEARDFELCELLDGVLRMSESQATACGVRLDAAYAPSGPVLLHADPSRLRQVMLNLLSNAIKYNRPGGWVRVALVRDPEFVHISVHDNGLGMSERQQAGLFQPFNRLGRESSGVPGTGIGLVLVRQLVGLMGGELTLESRADEGTVVRVALPAAVHSGAVGPGAGDGPDADATTGVVLYIEDNPVNAMLVERLLARWPGTHLVVAGNGASGLERASALRPDVVLLDMQLPDVDGLEVLKRLKADPVTRGLTVVALSASAVPEDVAAALRAGALDYWTKPIDFDAFIGAMRRLLRNDRRPDGTEVMGEIST